MYDLRNAVGKGGKRMSRFGRLDSTCSSRGLGRSRSPMMHLRAFATALSAGCILLVPAGAKAQDAHYWTAQFGPRASLLGGAVIGSISDVSGTFY